MKNNTTPYLYGIRWEEVIFTKLSWEKISYNILYMPLLQKYTHTYILVKRKSKKIGNPLTIIITPPVFQTQ